MIALPPRQPPAQEVTDILAAERIEVLAHYEPKPPRENFPFKAYRQAPVKQALVELFHGKCAYCEIYVRGGYPGDIEHYRPKGRVQRLGRVNGKLAYYTPGYYWLASEWKNLLFSCNECNSGGTKEMPDPEAPEDRSKWVVRTTGKVDQFPLLDMKKRARRSKDNLSRERPLLLNPCWPEHDPSRHLEFDYEGRIRPKGKGLVRARAVASILVYRLARPELEDKRRERARDVASYWKRSRDAENNLKRTPTSGQRGELLNEVLQLDRAFRPGAEHLAVANVVVERAKVDHLRGLAKQVAQQLLADDDGLLYLNVLREWDWWNALDRRTTGAALKGKRAKLIQQLTPTAVGSANVVISPSLGKAGRKKLASAARVSAGVSFPRALAQLIAGTGLALRLEGRELHIEPVAEARAVWTQWLATTTFLG